MTITGIVCAIVLKLSLGIIGAVVLLLVATLMLNHAQLMQPPGPIERLAVYLTRNSAQTTSDHEFSELKTPVFQASADDVYIALQDAVLELGWNVVSSNESTMQMEIMVETKLLRFKDDVYVSIKPMGCKDGIYITEMNVRSHSRKGTGDFGANAGHIQKLIAKVNQRVRRNAAMLSDSEMDSSGEDDGRDLGRR